MIETVLDFERELIAIGVNRCTFICRGKNDFSVVVAIPVDDDKNYAFVAEGSNLVIACNAALEHMRLRVKRQAEMVPQ